MSQTITIEVSDEAFAVLEEQSRRRGVNPCDVAAAQVEKLVASPRVRIPGAFERNFGIVSFDDPRGSDNELIDEDLAREYGSTHEPA